MRRFSASVIATLALTRPVLAAEESAPAAKTTSPVVAYATWLVAQAIPSPLLVLSVGAGDEHVGGGVRWQVTPLLYSFGITEKPLRAFVVSPIARHSGSVELHASPEWACCAPEDRTSWLLRSGLRVYLPLIEHGELLSFSLGGSYYRAAGGGGFSGDVGIYTLEGVLGLNVTVSPALDRREFVGALTIRYF